MYRFFRRRCFATLQFLGIVSIHQSINQSSIHPSIHRVIHLFVPPFMPCLSTLHRASIQTPPKSSLSTQLEHSIMFFLFFLSFFLSLLFIITVPSSSIRIPTYLNHNSSSRSLYAPRQRREPRWMDTPSLQQVYSEQSYIWRAD